MMQQQVYHVADQPGQYFIHPAAASGGRWFQESMVCV